MICSGMNAFAHMIIIYLIQVIVKIKLYLQALPYKTEKTAKIFKRYIDKHQNEVYIAFHEKAKASLMSRRILVKGAFFVDVMIRTDRIDRQKEDKTYVVRR